MKIKILLLAFAILTINTQAPAYNKPRLIKNTRYKTQAEKKTDSIRQSELDKVLAKLKNQNSNLNSYEAKIEYLFIQDPELIDSRITRKGKIYYQKEKKGSMLKIRFDRRQEDDDQEQKRIEEYYFDGVWLKIIDHLNKTINTYQKAKPNKPVDAFELISRDFPIVGFTSKDDLSKNFDITLVEDKKDENSLTTRLKLKVKKGSPYSKNYSEIDFYIDNKTFMPVRMRTKSAGAEGDIYDFKFTDSKINKKLKESVFKVEKPANFSENIYPLKEK